MDTEPKHAAKEFLKVKKIDIVEWPRQSPDLNSTEQLFIY